MTSAIKERPVWDFFEKLTIDASIGDLPHKEMWVRVVDNHVDTSVVLLTGEDIVATVDWDDDGEATFHEFVASEPGQHGHWETGVTF